MRLDATHSYNLLLLSGRVFSHSSGGLSRHDSIGLLWLNMTEILFSMHIQTSITGFTFTQISTSMSNEPAPDLHLAEPENDPEKPCVEVHDEIVSLGHLSSDSDIPARQIMNSSDEGIDEKKLLHKIDYALIPWLGILYLLSFLDRSSIGNAKVCELNLIYDVITDRQCSSMAWKLTCASQTHNI